MFTGMIEIHDFDGPVEMPGGNPPDPRSTISQHHHLVGLSQTATHRLRIDPPTEGLGGLNGAHVGRGVFVPQRISLVVLPSRGGPPERPCHRWRYTGSARREPKASLCPIE